MILSCGEALIDMLPRESAAGEPCFAPYPGGAVFNTAIALGRLGAPSGFFSGISQDLFGQQLIAALAASKVETGAVVRSDRPTTLAFVQLVEGQARYAFYDEKTAGRMLGINDLPDVYNDVEAMFFGGISLVVEPCGSAYEALMLREAAHRVTMIDPNVRPSFIQDEAAYRARIERMIAAADIVKLSDEDAHWLYGSGDLQEIARNVVSKGPALALITDGASGAHGVTADGAIFHAATEVDVADTVGAGDTFNAGALAALQRAGALRKDTLRGVTEAQVAEALALGTRAAAITVSRAGANPPWAHEL